LIEDDEIKSWSYKDHVIYMVLWAWLHTKLLWNCGFVLAFMGTSISDNAQILNYSNVWIEDTASVLHTAQDKSEFYKWQSIQWAGKHRR